MIIHSTVLAPDGRRMSKSLGTGIDPLDVIAEHGADAMRYGLLKMSSTQDVRFSYGAVEEGRKLANKLWNVARLFVTNAGDTTPDSRPQSLEERWILGRLDAAQATIEAALERFDFAEVVDTLYHVTFDEFCDWYAEAIKPRLGEEDARATAYAALERLLKLLHPVMPHVTEEIWTQLPARESRLIVAPWPERDERFAADADALDRVQEAAAIFARSGVRIELDEDEERIFNAKVRPERVQANGNAAAEIERLRKEIARAEQMLANARFVERAPPEVVEAEREKLDPLPARARGARGRRVARAPLQPSNSLLQGGVSAGPETWWIELLAPWPDEFGLERMQALLRELGDPQRAYPAIHVVGTNGKSTTTRATAALLRREGLRRRRVHLAAVSGWSEHIQVDGRDADFEAAVARVHHAAERTGATQFETLTAAALVAFAEAGVDVAVVEAGLGGAGDATNVLETRVVVLTNVSLDHTEELGDTREEIARAELAVIRPGAAVVLGEPEWEPLARELGAADVVVVAADGPGLRPSAALATAAAAVFLGRAPGDNDAS